MHVHMCTCVFVCRTLKGFKNFIIRQVSSTRPWDEMTFRGQSCHSHKLCPVQVRSLNGSAPLALGCVQMLHPLQWPVWVLVSSGLYWLSPHKRQVEQIRKDFLQYELGIFPHFKVNKKPEDTQFPIDREFLSFGWKKQDDAFNLSKSLIFLLKAGTDIKSLCISGLPGQQPVLGKEERVWEASTNSVLTNALCRSDCFWGKSQKA